MLNKTHPKVRLEKTYISREATSSLIQIDFSDTFATTNHQNDLQTITNLIFNTIPTWLTWLLNIRNWLVQFIGLKHEKPAGYHTNYEVGGYVAFFKIFKISSNEITLGADDSHLNFRAIVTDTQTEHFNIKVTTLVKFNNKTGKIYMKIIAPFHRFVVKQIVKQAFVENAPK